MSLINKIKSNRWKAFGLVVLAAILIITYIDNVFKVNSLLSEIQQLEKQYDEVRTSNQVLITKIIELESASRITKIAEEKLGMNKPTKVPQKIKLRNEE
ncbi:MAG TPA: FtsL-like putative cell division protein [Candidatus Kapabacteria bacterium]|jgi:cell division protein FtsL|nr:FtsL-like putative cell division protein [Candidatus Kapabacteria bacterium]HOM04156.1 FtsL-like putative cell division protein [Candidatus Kapabacteria bacterium]HOQ49185.1 FtsL-like putative cell division protein [Candidatus Kapabacteria bacterium]HPP39870.1 FtsL-like putative cell division protein [Candidatus Kapabacteria bacterium]HPU23544.1 FtsL-like putative cell division protein [Candidatus Kapabacteria bacterium]